MTTYKNSFHYYNNISAKINNQNKYIFLKKAINNIKSSNFNPTIIKNMLLATCMHGCHNKNNCHEILLYFLKKNRIMY